MMSEAKNDRTAPVPKHILVADDSATVRHLLAVILQRYFGCDITEAVDGVDAFAKLGSGHYDLLVTDVNMPRMTGLALVEKIRGGGASDIPIIIVTTKGAVRDRERGLELGADAYITKPINGGRLAAAAGALLYGE